MRLLFLIAFLALPTLAHAQTVTPPPCPVGYALNPSYTASPMTQPPCVAVAVAPVAPVVPAIDPTLFWLQQQQILQQQQREQEMRMRWQWEHEHPDVHPGPH